jgi:hypothetical protein
MRIAIFDSEEWTDRRYIDAANVLGVCISVPLAHGAFDVVRPWQRQCSPRCRQRAYVQRKITRPVRYYGA